MPREVEELYERRYRISWKNRVLLLRMCAREIERLGPLAQKERDHNENGGQPYRDDSYNLLRETQVMAFTLGEDHPTGGRRTEWVWFTVTKKWCIEHADALEKTVSENKQILPRRPGMSQT